MEGRLVITALIFTLIASCNKQDIPVQNSQVTLQQPQNGPVYASAWETIPAWNKTKNGDAISFSYTRTMPALKKEMGSDGVVLVFARNLWSNDAELKEAKDEPEKPLMMPFYFLPYQEQPNYTEQWNYNLSDDKINISLVVRGNENVAPPKKVELQFVVIPGQLLKEKKKTVQDVHKLSYNQLIQIFSTGS